MATDLGFAILRAEKLTSKTVTRTRVQHAVREGDVPNADKNRAHLNQIIGPKTYADFKTKLDGLLKGVRKFRSDSPEVIELFIGASPQFFKEGGDQHAFFRKSIDWVGETFGKENVLLTAVHRDETSPHLSVFVCPRIKNPEIAEYERQQRGDPAPPPAKGKKGHRRTKPFSERPPELALSAISYMKGKASLSSLQTSFYEKAGKPVGLKRGVEGSKAVHVDLNDWAAAVAMFKEDALADHHFPEPSGWDHVNPKAYLEKVKEAGKTVFEYAKIKIGELEAEKAKMQIEAKRMKNWEDHLTEKSGNLETEIKTNGAAVATVALAQVTQRLESVTVLEEKLAASETQIVELQAQVAASDATAKKQASEKSLVLRALAKTIKNDYPGPKMLELEAALGVEPGRDDIFARLVKSGRVTDFESAVVLVASYIEYKDDEGGGRIGNGSIPDAPMMRQ